MKNLYILLVFIVAISGNLIASNAYACPEVTAPNQSFCQDTNPTVADLLPSDALWFTSNDPGATPLSDTTPLSDGMIYYAGDQAETCTTRPQVAVTLTGPVYTGSNTVFSEECNSDVPRLFPDLGAINNYLWDMLEEGTPGGGTFSPNASQLAAEYQAATIINYEDFFITYTYNDNGCQDSVAMTLRIHETVSAGLKRELIVSPTDPPFIMVDSLGGTPSLSGSWNKLADGVFDPAVDPSGVYTYIVPGGSCTDTAYLVIYVDGNEGELGNKTYSPYNGLNSTNENFVYTRSPRVSIENSSEIEFENEVMEQITYFDGLGRSKQSIAIRGGGDLEDMVTPIEYDSYGRQVKEYLPYAASSQQGQIFMDPLTDISNFYNTEKYEFTANPYSEKNLESSPLNRVNQQGAPGTAWSIGGGHEIEFSYETNTADEVRMLSVNFTNGDFRVPNLEDNGYYPTGTLFKTITKDEQNDEVLTGKNHSTEEFKDKQGRVVLKRTYANTDTQSQEPHDTYYVYDDYGNLTYVLPPEMNATDATLVNLNNDLPALGYQYEYDSRNRLGEKQLPGKGREYIVYNQLDQPILTQDALQRESDTWLYTKYDAFGRIISTGKFTDTSPDQETMQAAVQNYYDTNGNKVYEEKNGTVYTNRSFPTTNTTVLTENFYDNYNFDSAGIIIPGSNIYSKPIEAIKTQGLATGSRIKVLGDAAWITTVNGYDDKGRLIWSTVKNDFLETTYVVESELDFVGNTLRQTTTHHKTNVAEDIITEDTFNYDHMNRLLTHQQSINNGPQELIAHNTYDELGQLITKGVGYGIESVESEDDFVETTYTDLINATINADGSIAKTGSGEEDGFVETVQEFSQDGYVEFTPSGTDRLFMVGLTYEDPDYLDSDFTYYAYVVRDYIRTYEGGSEGWSSPATQTPVAPGDKITVERIGYKIYYKKNGETFYVSPYFSAGKLKGKVLLSAAGTNGTSVGYMELHKRDRKTKYLQEIDYTYNIRGWLKQINDPDNLGEDLFGFKIGYNNPGTPGAIALYNGNISETYWNSQSTNSSGNPVSHYYRYSYDALNRITGATDETGNYNLSGISYDKMGNILSLQRQGHIDAGATLFGTMDNLSYSYTGNRLMQVADSSLKSQGFNDGNAGVDYSYDVNGNLTSDANKGVSAVEYNHLNMPTKITVTGANAGVLDYVYSANGIKLQKKKTVGGNITTTDYAGNFLYENGMLKQFFHSEGYTEPDGSSYRYVYQYTDIWNNVRLSYSDFNNDGTVTASEIIQERNYYPFGLVHKGYNSNVISENNFQTYQDQEFTKDLDLNVHEWKYRFSDPAIGRFWQIDPLAEKYTYNSTYAFQENKLGSGIELEGLENSSFEMRQRYRDKQLLKGKMSSEEYIKQGSAEGKGAITALTIISPIDEATIAVGLLSKGFSALKGFFQAKTVVKIADELSDAAKTLAKNKDIGKKGEDLVNKQLKDEFPADDVRKQVTGKFEDGSTTRFDDVVVDPKTGKVKLVNETKTGNGQLTNQQKRFHNEGESATLTGKNARNASGQTVNTTNTTTRTTRVKREDIE